jgi:hypothetical protein
VSIAGTSGLARSTKVSTAGGRWRVPESGQLFEVQFHTQASLDAKEETHGAYEQIRSLPDNDAEVSRLHAYQREVTAKVPTPPGAPGIPDYP